MTATLTALQTDLLTRIATRRDAGQHTWGTDILDIPTRTVTSATKRGLIEATDQGWALTDAGRAAIGRASAPAEAPMAASVISGKAKAELNRCACSEDCEATTRNLFAPGHDARWAGITGRQIAAYASMDDAWNEVESAGVEVGASRALMQKALRVAENAIARAAAKSA